LIKILAAEDPTKSWKSAYDTMKMYCEKTNKKSMTNIRPYKPIFSIIRLKRGEIRLISLEPSKGGMGNRLKTANIIFKKTTNPRRAIAIGGITDADSLITNAKIIAKDIFDKGPASATLSGPYR